MREGIKSFLFVLTTVVAILYGFDSFVTGGRLWQTFVDVTAADRFLSSMASMFT